MRKFDRQQVVADLLAAYPGMVRLAALLCVREQTARNVARFVLSRAVPAWVTWTSPAQQQAWFFHHTLLNARRALPATTAARESYDRHDVLLAGHAVAPAGTPGKVGTTHTSGDLRGTANHTGVEYVAFVAALRELPVQQAEAWILFELLDFDLRQSAVTMDLSTTATQNHLAAARAALKLLSGDGYDRLLQAARTTVAAYVPDTAPAIPLLNDAVRRYLWPKRLRAAGTLVLIAAALAIAAYLWRVVYS